VTVAYHAQGVPSIPAGRAYLDPTTGVRVHRLTSATFPAASPNWAHDYAEFGNEVSLPWKADGTRTILTNSWGRLGWWLFDFTPGVGVGNPRRLTGALVPVESVSFTFSNNPATPHYAYVGSGGRVVRFDIRTMTEAPGDGWPVNGVGHQLAQAVNDSFFTWTNAVHGTTQTAYTPATRRVVSRTQGTGIFISRAGRYAGISEDPGIALWDTETDTIIWHYHPKGRFIAISHGASLQGLYLANNIYASFPEVWGTISLTPSGPSPVNRWGPTVGPSFYCSGTWVQPGDQANAWVACSSYGALTPSMPRALSPGGIVLLTANGERRLLAHMYSTQSAYTWYSWAKLSPDGAYVLFTSDMNGSGRNDLFLAELPTTAGRPSSALRR
jgi:hypothetical protein